MSTGNISIECVLQHSSFQIFCRSTLFALVSQAKETVDVSDRSSCVNYKFLSSPDMIERMRSLQRHNRCLTLKVGRLKSKVAAVIESADQGSIVLDSQTSTDFQKIMEEETASITSMFEENSFPAIFWKAQQESVSKSEKQKNGVRWHPLMIKWCLYIRHQSSKAYETLRNSGIALPSQRTLRDYSNAVKAGAGFSSEVDCQLLQAAQLTKSPECHRLICILIDEMHIKEELVYNKHSGQLIGFADLGDVNNHLSRFEQSLLHDSDDPVNDSSPPPLAKSMVAFMVRGLFSKLQFVYAQFPCLSLTGEQLFFPFWEVVSHLERMGFKVKIITNVIQLFYLHVCCYIYLYYRF